MLRVCGPNINPTSLNVFDRQLYCCIDNILGGPIGLSSQQHANLGVTTGGMGFRRARDVALPAFIAARMAALPFIKHLGERLNEVGLMPIGFGQYVHDTYIEARIKFRNNLSGDRARCFDDHLKSIQCDVIMFFLIIFIQRDVYYLKDFNSLCLINCGFFSVVDDPTINGFVQRMFHITRVR